MLFFTTLCLPFCLSCNRAFGDIATLALYGVGENAAGAFALVAHGIQMILIMILGIYTMFSIALEKKNVQAEEQPQMDHKEINVLP